MPTMPQVLTRTLLAPALIAGVASAVDGQEIALLQDQEESDWPYYNRTPTAERFSPLAQITRNNVGMLTVICSYDTGQETGFQTSPIVVDGTMYLTTEFDTIALDPGNCREKWRANVEHEPSLLGVNRGVAFLDGAVFRGTQDGRVVAYDADDGSQLWETKIADPAKGETVPAAPIAWSGLVFVGNAGGDIYGVKGRMYALDAKTGDIRWEFYLVPQDPVSAEAAAGDRADEKQLAAASWENDRDVPIAGGATWTTYTLDPERGLLYVPGGNPAPDFVPELRPGDNLFTNSIVVLDARSGEYRAHYQLVPEDFHDWDVAAAPALLTAENGRRILAAAPKDGYLYGYDLASGERLYKMPITTIENERAPLTSEGTRFCPGTQGGVEWNGPAYSPETNLIYTGAVDWCSTVRVADPEEVKSVSLGQPWSGSADEQNLYGTFDPPERWAGWLYASDPQTGTTAWRFKAQAPLLSGVTPTAGGVVFFGDMAGRAYALDAESGEELWTRELGGAAGGGVITYTSGGRQRVAYAAGMTSPIWPTEKTTGKIIVLGVQ